MKPAVLVTMQLPPAAMSRLEQHAAVTTVLDQSDPRFAAALAGAEGMLINPRTRIDRELLARAGQKDRDRVERSVLWPSGRQAGPNEAKE
jgi:lactate dehydrogenase-like 2-hydroxyacid dehydrogenase